MKKSLLELYALLVCFAMVASFTISLGIGLYDIAEVAAPELTLGSISFEKHSTNEAFTANWSQAKLQNHSPEQIKTLREESYQISIIAKRREAYQSLVATSIVIAISVVVFAIHWKIAKKSRIGRK